MPSPEAELQSWLAHCECLHPTEIELSLDRVAAVRARLALTFECPVLTVAGTNGKGSTCAFLASILGRSGYRVGIYSSPHLVRFEERCHIDGHMASAQALLPHFEAVEAARQAESVSLTYFEFTTLVILRCLSHADLDAAILEVGLGGRLDAVNVIDPDCAVITSIDIDHADLLGATRDLISLEKAGIARAQRPVVISDPRPPQVMLDHLTQLGAQVQLIGRDFDYASHQGDNGQWLQWSWSGLTHRYSGLAFPALRGSNQLLNASGALAALDALSVLLPVTAQGVREGLSLASLPGRFQIMPGQPVVVLDVAHNPHAAATLAANLDQMGFYPKTRAVFGAMADKDVAGLITPLLGIIDEWHCTDLPTPRAASAQKLAQVIRNALELRKNVNEHHIHTHSDPLSALEEVRIRTDSLDRILVFGSFYTVGGVLNHLERRK
jgi:dihydrofolate synthase/folylpolyglutamate synthase